MSNSKYTIVPEVKQENILDLIVYFLFFYFSVSDNPVFF